MNKFKKLLLGIGLSIGLVGGFALADQTPVANLRGGATVVGSIVQTAVGTPNAPTVTNVGTAGSTSMTYYCVGSDVNGNDTINSSSTVNTTSNATLTATNYNIIQCGGKVGAVLYKILKADTSHLLSTCNANKDGGQCEVVDNSTTAGTAYTAQTVDQTANLTSTNMKAVTTVTGCLTAGTLAATCAEPTATFAAPFADTNYRVACSCVGVVGVPSIVSVAKGASGVQVTILGETAATAQCATVECIAYHP